MCSVSPISSKWNPMSTQSGMFPRPCERCSWSQYRARLAYMTDLLGECQAQGAHWTEHFQNGMPNPFETVTRTLSNSEPNSNLTKQNRTEPNMEPIRSEQLRLAPLARSREARLARRRQFSSCCHSRKMGTRPA